MEFKKKLKLTKLRSYQNVHKEKTEPKVNLVDLPTEVLEIIASFFHGKQLTNFGLVNKQFKQICHGIKKRQTIDLRRCFRLDEKKMLDKAKTRYCVTLNLNYCHWLSSGAILELISKKSVRELKIIDCACTQEVIEAISKLNLSSLSFSLTREWASFFYPNHGDSIPCLNKLEKLKVFLPERGRDLLNEVTQDVLQHCHNLEYLKIFSRPMRVNRPSFFYILRKENVPTPVPKLETLILDVNCRNEISTNVRHLLNLILNEKKVPLKRIELGKQTANAIFNYLLFEKNVTLEQTRTLCLSSISSTNAFDIKCISNLLHAPGFGIAIDSMLKAPRCKRIEMENLDLAKLNIITEKIVKSGNTSIEQINFRGCLIKDSKLFIQSIDEIVSFCPRINFLDMSNTNWNSSGNNNPQLMESLSNLTNLRTLYLTPNMLSCEAEQQKIILELSFRKIVGKCVFVEDFRISELDDLSLTNGIILNSISENVLSSIKFFKNLRELHLVNFYASGMESALPEVAKSCTRLTYLYVKNIYNEEQGTYKLPLSQILNHTKQLKHLSLFQDFTLTEEFVDSLIKCTEIKKLCVRTSSDEAIEVNKYFASNLRKLTKLKVFITFGSKQVLENFRSAIDEIEDAKKPLFYRRDEFYKRIAMPLAHRHLLQYFYDQKFLPL